MLRRRADWYVYTGMMQKYEVFKEEVSEHKSWRVRFLRNVSSNQQPEGKQMLLPQENMLCYLARNI